MEVFLWERERRGRSWAVMATPRVGPRVLSEEARVGKRVRVREGARARRTRPILPTSAGTIQKRWGDAGYAALDVLLDDGSLRLFWHHELGKEVDAEDP